MKTVEKGYQLEKQFAEYMKSDLDYEKYKIHHRVKGKLNIIGTEVDVIAEKPDHRGMRFKRIAIAYYIVSAALLFIGFVLALDAIELGYALLFIGFTGLLSTFVLLAYSNKYNKEIGWVECKNLAQKVNINHIQKMLREYQDYIATGDKELKEIKLYFVSSAGYIDNALKFAETNNIICYEKHLYGFQICK